MTNEMPPQQDPNQQAQQPYQPQYQQGAAWWQQQGAQQQGTSYQHTAPFGPPPQPQQARGKRRLSVPIVATALVAGLVGGGVGVGGSALFDSGTSDGPSLTASAPVSNNVNAKPGSMAYAAQTASKSTADIKVRTAQGGSEGTGIILSSDGYVLTNNHVVSGAAGGGKLQVTGPNGKNYSGSVVGTAPSYDLAVVKLDGASGLTPAKLGRSSSLQVGQAVAAVGSPYGLADTVTSGIISALNRTVTTQGENGEAVVYNGLQTDAAINHGNSGGPLVNMDGQVVGVNSAINTGGGQSGSGQQGGGSIGLGFSIPIDTARRVANELMHDGKATKPVLGVTGSIAGSQAGSAQQTGGARLASVQNGSAAQQAGLKKGDTVTKLGKAPIGSYADLMAQVLKHTPGEQVPVTVRHAGGGTDTVQVTLGSRTDTAQTTVAPQQEGPYQQGPGGGLGGGGGFGGFGGGLGGN